MTIIITAEALLSEDELINTSDEDDFVEEVLNIYNNCILARKTQENFTEDDGIKLELRDISNETDDDYYIMKQANLSNSYYADNDICERCRNCKTCAQNQEAFVQSYTFTNSHDFDENSLSPRQREDTNFAQDTETYCDEVD